MPDDVRIDSSILRSPLLLDVQYVDAVMASATNANDATAFLFPMRMERPQPEIESGIATIQVHGALYQRGWGSYEWLMEDLESVLSNSQVRGVVLDIDSPGGIVSGCMDCAEWIYQQRGRKPILALANEYAASAAYAIASACDKVVLTRTAKVGSVGVLLQHWDISGALERWGERVTFVYAGQHKKDGNPYEPLPDSVRDRFQANVDGIYDIFVSLVARNRGISEDAVRATEALTYQGADALEVNFADDVQSAREAISAFETSIQRRRTSMPLSSAQRAERAAFIITEGTAFADKLTALVDAALSDDRKKEDVIAALGEAAGLDTTTIEALLDGDINGPTTAQVEALAAVLQCESKDLIEAAIADGCKLELPAADDPEEEDEHPAAADAGNERDRIKAIIESPHAVGKQELANHLAFNTDMAAADAEALLQKSPKAAATDPLSSAMDQFGSPDVDPGGDGGEQTAAGQWDQALKLAGVTK